VCESAAAQYGRHARTEPRPRISPNPNSPPKEVKSGASFALSSYSPVCEFGSMPMCGRAAVPTLTSGSNAVTTVLSIVRRIVS
jgi:hypothetical protein